MSDSIPQRAFDYLKGRGEPAKTSEIAEALDVSNETALPALKRHPDVFLRGKRSKGRPVTWWLAPDAERPPDSKFRAARGADASPAFAAMPMNIGNRHAWRPQRKDSQSHWAADKIEFVDVHVRGFLDWIADRKEEYA